MDDFDAQALAEMRRIYDDEGVVEIVDAMAQDLPGQRAQLEAGARQHDLTSFKRAAHSLKSTARLVGAVELGLLWERIEGLSAEPTLEAAVARVPEALQRQERLVERLQRELADRSS